MTDAVVGVLLTELFKNLKDQSNVFFGFKTQFNQMAETLKPMESFLNDVHKLKTHKGTETVKCSLATLRELIYDADDILLDCRIRDDHRSDCICSPRELIFCYRTGNQLMEINRQINLMEKNFNTYLGPIMNQIKNNGDDNTRWRTRKYNQADTVGLNEDTKKIKQWILQQNEELQRVGIVGMGGLGKTTLTQKIFNDNDVKTRFKKRIWVSVSQTFTPKNIMKNMLEQLHTVENVNENENAAGQTFVITDSISEGMLLDKIQLALMNRSYLIVMDDVWSTENGFGWWEEISKGLPKQEEYNCSIIITTRNEDVAKSMGVVEGRIHRPKILDENDSWTLFCKLAFMSTKGICKRLDLKPVGKEIVNKCNGLPLAIKAIGGLLSRKTQSTSEWENIRNEFHEKLVNNGKEESVITSLQLSYDELPRELKHCMLCFSIYPEDSEISGEQLVRWWVGEGFVSGNETKTATQKAFDCLSELFSRCLVEVVNHRGYDGRIFNCKMHDMVRELIIRMAKEEAFCSFGGGNVQQFDAKSRHLGFTSETHGQIIINTKLRALLMPSYSFSFSKKTNLAKVSSLRVLDLSKIKLDDVYFEHLLDWIKSQKRLAYLNLRGVSGLKEVSKWIRELKNLQLLILTECNNLETLSPGITTLPKLTVLDVGNCPSLRNLPKGLGNLTNLQELSGFKLASPSAEGCRLRDLGSLTKLRVLRINIREEDDISDEELKVLSGLNYLQVLSIDTKDCEKKEILEKLDQLSPPQSLQELYLRYHHKEFTPSWVTPSALPHLKYLCIEDGELAGLSPSFGGNKEKPWSIEGLCLKYLPRLKVEWKTLREMMPSIKYVEVSRCYELQKFPFKVEYPGFWRKGEEEEEETQEEMVE